MKPKSKSKLGKYIPRSQLIAALQQIISAFDVSETQKKWVIRAKGVAVYPMDPNDFLKLTTRNQADIDPIMDKAKSIEFYNSKAKEGGITVHPFVDVIAETGKVKAHEGRHRAAALIKEGIDIFQVAILVRPEYKHWEIEDLPTTLYGQYNSYSVDLDYAKMDWVKENLADPDSDEIVW